MSKGSEAFKAIPQEAKDLLIRSRICVVDSKGTVLLDQGLLETSVRTSRTYLEVLSSPGFQHVPNGELVLQSETEFLESALRIAKSYGVPDAFLEGIKPDMQSRKRIIQAVRLLSEKFPEL